MRVVEKLGFCRPFSAPRNALRYAYRLDVFYASTFLNGQLNLLLLDTKTTIRTVNMKMKIMVCSK